MKADVVPCLISPNSVFAKFCGMLSPRKPAAKLKQLTPSDELKRLAYFLDVDGDGKISAAELQNCLRIVGEELSCEDAEAVVQALDSDGDGQLCFDEFVELAKAEEECEDERRRYLREAFRVYEMEGEKCITPQSLRRVLGRLGQSKTVDECREMIRRYDIDGDGVICYNEFEIMLAA